MIPPLSMTTLELQLADLVGLAVAWESFAAALGALLVGLTVGTAFRFRATRQHKATIAEGARGLESMRRIASELARTPDVDGVARALLDEIGVLFGVDFAALPFVSEGGGEAAGYLARSHGDDVEWWNDVRVDLLQEPSGIATAAREATAFAVYDVGDTGVTARLAAATGAKSAAYIPLITADRVIAVISVATREGHRAFSSDELTLMQAFASDATIALERTRSDIALGEALDRERLLR